MKKIMFNDQYGLTTAVLAGRKTQTRRLFHIPMGMDVKIVHTKGHDIDGNLSTHDDLLVFLTSPKSEREVTIDDVTYKNYVKFVQPPIHVGDLLAIAQSYKDVNYVKLYGPEKVITLIGSSGWNNKMFVKAELMPHHIKITDVRLERLQDISDEDCLREGVGKCKEEHVIGYPFGVPFNFYIKEDVKGNRYSIPREAFSALIDGVSGKGTWELNPYVIVYDFELVD